MANNIFKKRITQNNINFWSMPVVPSGTNCAETAFTFLGVISRDECIASKTNTGKFLNQITNVLLERAHGNFNFREIKFDEELIRLLTPNFMTLGLLKRYNNIGHAVAIAVNQNNEIVLIDPQLKLGVFTGMNSILEYLRKGNYLFPDGSYNLNIAISKKKTRNNSLFNNNSRSKKRQRTNINDLTLRMEQLALGKPIIKTKTKTKTKTKKRTTSKKLKKKKRTTSKKLKKKKRNHSKKTK